MYPKAAVIAAFAGLAAAAPGPFDSPYIFSGVGQNTPSAAINKQPIVAMNGYFWLNTLNHATTFCPNHIDCSPYDTTATVFRFDPDTKRLWLAADVPGGQYVFVDDKDGSLSFDPPYGRSKKTDPFEYTPQTSEEGGILTYKNEGWVACPVAIVGADGKWAFKVYAKAMLKVLEHPLTYCVDFEFGVLKWTDKAPYSYY